MSPTREMLADFYAEMEALTDSRVGGLGFDSTRRIQQATKFTVDGTRRAGDNADHTFGSFCAKYAAARERAWMLRRLREHLDELAAELTPTSVGTLLDRILDPRSSPLTDDDR